jgi:uncharacterized protein YabN with tetrapyrrole methylase and pyrophosphatase domain
LYVNVWSVEYEQFEDFAAVEDFQDPEAVSAAGRRQVLAAFPVDPMIKGEQRGERRVAIVALT